MDEDHLSQPGNHQRGAGQKRSKRISDRATGTLELRQMVEEKLLDAGVPMYAADLEGNLVYANVQYRNLLMLLKPSSEIKDAIVSPQALARVVNDGKPWFVDETFAVDGATKQFHVHHFPIMGRDNELVAVGGIYYDSLREQKIASRGAQLQARLDDITRLVSDWVWETDSQLNFSYISSRILELFGIHPRLVLGTNLLDFGRFDESSENAPTPSLRTPFRDQTFRIVGYDRRERVCLLSGMPLFDTRTGDFTGYRGTGTDISKRLEAEERAARASNQLLEAIESSSEGFALFDSEDRLAICNSKYREYHSGIADKLIPGATFESLIRSAAEAGVFAETSDKIDSWVEDQVNRHKKPNGTFEMQLADGRWLRASDRRTGDGCIVCLRTDITHFKRREHALRLAEETSRQARDLAQRANSSKSEFLANVSHELRTPLNAIIGFSEIMLAEMFGAVGSEQYKGYLRDIHDSGAHLLNLINDILDVAKAEAGKLELIESNVDVAEVVQSCLRLLSETASRSDVALGSDPVSYTHLTLPTKRIV